MPTITLPWRAVLAAALLAGCSNAGQDRIVEVKAFGVVKGLVYFDANGSKSFELSGGDSVLAGIGVRLIWEGTSDTAARATTATNGVYRLASTPVGNYVIAVDTTRFGDSLKIEKIDSTSFTVRPTDSVTVNVAVSYPQVSVAAARLLLPGRSVFVTGVAFNSLGTFSDTVVFLGDTSRAIRLTRLRTAVAAGDSVRVRGVTSSRAGQPTLDAGTTIALGRGLFPPVVTLTTAVAATAAGGTRDAALVSVRGATIVSTLQTSTNFVLTVDDSSGALDVELDPASDGAFKPANLPGIYIPGNKFDLLGVLAPTGTGSWRLRPRSATDLTLIPLPVISIAAARALPAGRTVVVVGIALNNPNIFSDTTVHLADTSGAIRLTRLRSPITAGDSVKVKAVTGLRALQPTLDGGTTTPLGLGLPPAPVTLTTAAAATAVGGTRDAQLVFVLNATVSDTATVVGAFKLTVSDGSGNLDVLLDQRIAFIVPGQYIPTNRFNIVGLLVPTGTGAWTLKPRSSADLTKQ
jgi:hypothetical protein